MRKQIKSYVTFCFFLWFVTFILFIIFFLSPNNTPLFIRFTPLVIALFMMFYTLYLLVSWTQSGLDKHWFTTLEELTEEKQKATKEWEKASKLIKVIGEHEAVKLWRAEKEKEVKNE